LKTPLSCLTRRTKQYPKLISGLLMIWLWVWKQSISCQMVKCKVFARLMLAQKWILWSSPLLHCMVLNIFHRLKGSIISIAWSSCGFRLRVEIYLKLDRSVISLDARDSLTKYARMKSQWHSLDQLIFHSWEKVKPSD